MLTPPRGSRVSRSSAMRKRLVDKISYLSARSETIASSEKAQLLRELSIAHDRLQASVSKRYTAHRGSLPHRRRDRGSWRVSRVSQKEILVGNGGAPLTSGSAY